MGRIPEDVIHAVRERVDIVDLVGRHVSLKKAGRTHKGLCPFHHEKTPSFIVSPDRGTFHCFGCGEGGNAFSFMMKHENLTFPEAVRSLAADVGVEVPETGRASGDRGLLEQVFRANDVAQTLYREALFSDEGRGARAYLVERGLDREVAATFGIGFAPDRWDAVVSALGNEKIDARIGARAGLTKERERGGHFDMLRGRITFPIQDVRGRVIGFGGRALAKDQEPKYLNTPESPVFRKREAFYGFPASLEPMRRADRAVVVEGYFDCIALHQAEIGEAVATCGTALTEEHARNLRRRTKNVVLLFDGDEAGQRAILRSLEVLLPQGLRVRAASIPGGADPDDYLRSDGAEALRKLIDDAPPAIELAIGRASAAGISTPWERADAVGAVVPLLALVGDPVERGEWARRLALATGTELADVEATVRQAASGAGAKGRRPDDPEPKPQPPRRRSREERTYGDLLRLLIEHPLPIDPARVGSAAPSDAWRLLAGRVLDARGEPRGIEQLLDALDEATSKMLSALVAEERPDLEDPELAPRVAEDLLGWLERRRERAASDSLTRQISATPSGAGDDALEMLRRKQEQLERRREAASPITRS